MAICKKLFVEIQSECECTDVCFEVALNLGHGYQYPSDEEMDKSLSKLSMLASFNCFSGRFAPDEH